MLKTRGRYTSYNSPQWFHRGGCYVVLGVGGHQSKFAEVKWSCHVSCADVDCQQSVGPREMQYWESQAHAYNWRVGADALDDGGQDGYKAVETSSASWAGIETGQVYDKNWYIWLVMQY